MSAEIVQFVPGLKPARMTVKEAIDGLSKMPQDANVTALTVSLQDTAPSEYSAPDGDCA